MTDYLATTLAAEEHRQGMAYGDDADHCGDCKAEAERRLQAECEHDGEQISMPEFGKATVTVWCKRCGLWREEQP